MIAGLFTAEANDLGVGGGCIILLDVPPGSAITLDGVTRITPPSPPTPSSALPFGRGLWIIGGVRPSLDRTDDDEFHLLVVRPGAGADGSRRASPVGFVLAPSPGDATTTSSADAAADSGYGWVFARRYDPRTEEVSNDMVDESTLKSLAIAVGDGGELRKYVIPYDRFFARPPGPGASENIDRNVSSSWGACSSRVNHQFLRRRHGMSHGDKIVPSSKDGGCGHNIAARDDPRAVGASSAVDGAPASYPPIPCIDQTVSARRLAQHLGTRAYLSTLSPEERTRLLIGGSRSGCAEMSSGEYVLKDVLHRYYGEDGEVSDIGGCNRAKNDGCLDNVESSIANFLADIQLSFLLFLFLECHTSLEHWRDALSMCALSVADPSANTIIQLPTLFHQLLSILHQQLSCIEANFFEEAEYSSGEDNFMVWALRMLCDACEGSAGKRKRGGDAVAESLMAESCDLKRLVRDRFGLDLAASRVDDDCDMHLETVELAMEDDVDNGCERTSADAAHDIWEEENGDEEDGPVIIPYDQVEASIARFSSRPSAALGRSVERYTSGASGAQCHRKEYPLLYAAMTEGEDEVMACARILDEANDASLVREAAAYLEEVEAHRGAKF